MSVTSLVIANVNETIQKLQLDEKTFIDNINKNDLAQLNDKLAIIEARLPFFEICEKLIEGYLFLENNFGNILNSIAFARFKIIHSSILTPDNLIAVL